MGPKGIAGYPEGIIEQPDAYRAELSAPLHARSLRREGAARPEGAIEVGSDWGVVVDCACSPQIDTAVADFLGFMEVCMETPLHGRGKPLRLTITPGKFEAAESYRIDVAPDAIEIVAADAKGLQYALYEIEGEMRSAGGPFVPPMPEVRRPWLETRILRSFYAPYYTNELLAGGEYYPDEYLNRLAHSRINGIWLHLKLRDIVPSAIFPEFGKQAEETLPRLRALVERAARYGIKVFLYMLEPRAVPQDDPFWRAHPEVKGRAEGPILEGWDATYAMCTTGTPTLKWLREASERLFREVPGLGGTFHITASEEHTHCFSHASAPADKKPPYEATGCPRCRNRRAADVIAEIIGAFEKGIHAADPAAKVIVWNWSWEGPYGVEGEREIISKLPDGVALMLDFERGDTKTVLGKELSIDEYALSFVGPSQRFNRSAGWAAERGLPVYGKFQFVNTHELADGPHTPLPGVVYDKFANLRAAGTTGMLGCWIFGNYPGMIVDLAGRLYFEPFPDGGKGEGAAGDKPPPYSKPSRDEVLNRLAADYFAPEAVADVREAWDLFAQAWDFYPFYVPMLYNGPHVQGPAFPWFLEPTHRRFPPNWLPDRQPGDNGLDQIPGGDVLWWDTCWASVIELWARGLVALERGIGKIPSPTLDQQKEYGVARVIWHQMQSVRNTYRFYVEREFLLSSDHENERGAILRRMHETVVDEIEQAEECIDYLDADSRLGWHSEAHQYLLSAEKVRKRVTDLRAMDDRIGEILAFGGGLMKPQPYDEVISEAAYLAIRAKLEEVGPIDLVKGIYPEEC